MPINSLCNVIVRTHCLLDFLRTVFYCCYASAFDRNAMMASGSVVPFSLHCTICYEPFDVTSRVPVILPCGHTYLCEPCSKRLKTCMECRTSLYMSPPKPPPNGYSPSYRHSTSPRFSPTAATLSPRSMNSRQTSPVSQVPSPRNEPVQLPVPKNLVLIALLEAAQEAVASERNDKDYESGDDDEKVVAGMNLLSSDYGTYVVRHEEGLVVHTVHPSSIEGEAKERLHGPFENAVEPSSEAAWESSKVTRESTGSALPVVFPEAFFPSLTADEDIESVDLHDPIGFDVLPSNLTLVERPSDEITCRDDIVLQGSVLQDTREEDKNTGEEDNLREEEDKNMGEEDAKTLLRLRFGQTVQVVSFVDGVARLARGRGYLVATSKQLVKVGDPVDNACKLEGMISSVTKKQEILRGELKELETVEFDLSRKLQEALLEPDDDPFATAPGFEDLLSLSSSPDTSPLNSRQTTGPLDGSSLAAPNLLQVESKSSDFDSFVFSVTAARDEQERRQSFSQNRQIEPSQLRQMDCTGGIFQGIFSNNDVGTVSPLYDVRRPRSASTSIHEGIDWSTGLSGHMGLTSASAHRKPKRREIRMMGEHRGISNILRIRPPTLGNPSW